MEECVMCCENTANCKLICNHSFCKGCVKTWYLKCKTDPTCPNCRHKLYFKGMYKMVKVWEEEAETMVNEDAFNEAFEYIVNFEMESESESDSDSESDFESDTEWESLGTDEDQDQAMELVSYGPNSMAWVPNDPSNLIRQNIEEEILREESVVDFSEFYSSEVIADLIKLQDRYHKALKYGLDIPGVLENDWFWDTMKFFGMGYDYIEDDIFPHTKKLFISNHKDTNIRRRTSKRIPPKADATETLVFYFEMSV